MRARVGGAGERVGVRLRARARAGARAAEVSDLVLAGVGERLKGNLACHDGLVEA